MRLRPRPAHLAERRRPVPRYRKPDPRRLRFHRLPMGGHPNRELRHYLRRLRCCRRRGGGCDNSCRLDRRSRSRRSSEQHDRAVSFRSVPGRGWRCEKLGEKREASTRRLLKSKGPAIGPCPVAQLPTCRPASIDTLALVGGGGSVACPLLSAQHQKGFLCECSPSRSRLRATNGNWRKPSRRARSKSIASSGSGREDCFRDPRYPGAARVPGH